MTSPDFTSPFHILERAAARNPTKTALISDDATLTYAELWDASRHVAQWLKDRGVDPGDRVSLYGENRWEWIAAYHGILAAGCVVNPLNVMLTPTEVAYATNDCAARVVFGSGARLSQLSREECAALEIVVSFDGPEHADVAFGDVLRVLVHETPTIAVDAESLCCIAYTSGTTGHPKGAMQTNRAVLLNCAYTATMHGRVSDDVVVTALPAPHVYGNVAINSTFLVGGTVRLMSRFDPGETLDAISTLGATLFEGVPTMYAMLLASHSLESADLSSLRRCTVGGQTIAESVIDAWEDASGAPLLELWGMTEIAGLGTTHSVHAPNVHGSVGVSLPGLEVRIDALDGGQTDLPPGTVGELMVRGPLVMTGYFANPQATAEAMAPDGWLHTGDVAHRSETGHVFVVDRVKDVVLTGGYNVYPAEIERVLVAHSGVALAAVGGAPDPIKGEIAVAYVVPREGHQLDESDLIDFCRARLAAYKLPREVHFVDVLPMTSTGKLMRRKLIRPRGSG